MKIVVFCPHFEDTGGVREVVARLAGEHVRTGHQVAIVTRTRRHVPSASLPLDSRVGLRRQDLAPAPHALRPWRITRRFLRRYLLGSLGLVRYVRATAPDVVATHCSKFYAPWVRLLGVASGVPVVAHLHNATQTADGPENLFWSRMLLGSCRRVIAVSPAVAAYAARVFPGVGGRIDVVRNGIDPGEFDDVSPERRDGAYLLAVGRLSAQKGFDVLLEAIAKLDRAPSLVIAGSGPDAEPLATRAARLGLGQRVTFLGEVPRERVKRLLAGARIVVMPSRFEGNPLIALEAMQAGTPLVASDIPGLPSELTDGVTGLLVPPDDPAALAAALDRLLGDPAASEAIGRTARDAARAIPSWAAVATRVAAVYAAASVPAQTRS